MSSARMRRIFGRAPVGSTELDAFSSLSTGRHCNNANVATINSANDRIDNRDLRNPHFIATRFDARSHTVLIAIADLLYWCIART